MKYLSASFFDSRGCLHTYTTAYGHKVQSTWMGRRANGSFGLTTCCPTCGKDVAYNGKHIKKCKGEVK